MSFTAPTHTNLVERYPDFSSVSQATLDVYLADAVVQVGASAGWGSQLAYTRAVLLYAAHTLTLDGYGSETVAAGDDISLVTDGAVTVRYANPQKNRSALAATLYGRRYLQVARDVAGVGIRTASTEPNPFGGIK